MKFRIEKKLIKAHKRKNLTNAGYVRQHYRTIIHKRGSLQKRTLDAIMSVFNKHPNLPLEVSDIHKESQIHRETIYKYLFKMEKMKKIKRSIINNRLYWVKA